MTFESGFLTARLKEEYDTSAAVQGDPDVIPSVRDLGL